MRWLPESPRIDPCRRQVQTTATPGRAHTSSSGTAARRRRRGPENEHRRSPTPASIAMPGSEAVHVVEVVRRVEHQKQNRPQQQAHESCNRVRPRQHRAPPPPPPRLGSEKLPRPASTRRGRRPARLTNANARHRRPCHPGPARHPETSSAAHACRAPAAGPPASGTRRLGEALPPRGAATSPRRRSRHRRPKSSAAEPRRRCELPRRNAA